jgi:serine/threonine-protein kinase
MIGRLLGNRYEITEKIDSGGMAYIYKATCRKTGNTVAVKILKETFSNNDEYVLRFKKEAETTFSLSHINVVHVMDIGCENGVYYMVMEYIDGETLKALVDRNGRLAENEAIDYALQICTPQGNHPS